LVAYPSAHEHSLYGKGAILNAHYTVTENEPMQSRGDTRHV
jgi:hypothetical protein